MEEGNSAAMEFPWIMLALALLLPAIGAGFWIASRRK